MLYIVSTPIGNLKDITLRALEVLKDVDLIACEDTRHTKVLLNHYDINTPTTSYHDHNKTVKSKTLVNKLLEGKTIALVSDAGTPGISDPGFVLVRAARENNIKVAVIPGACAAIAGLSLSALPSDSFIFEGFLPVKSAQIKKKLESLRQEKRTIIFYESPHRIIKTLECMKEVLDDPKVSLTREITKKFEECLTDRASVLLEGFNNKKPKGEFVVVLSLK